MAEREDTTAEVTRLFEPSKTAHSDMDSIEARFGGEIELHLTSGKLSFIGDLDQCSRRTWGFLLTCTRYAPDNQRRWVPLSLHGLASGSGYSADEIAVAISWLTDMRAIEWDWHQSENGAWIRKYAASYPQEIVARVDAEIARVMADTRDKSARQTKSSRRTRPGYVYLLRSETGVCKIGRTTKLSSRVTSLTGTTVSTKVEFLGAIWDEDHITLESGLHGIYAGSRVRGEWFRLTDEQIAEFRSFATVTELPAGVTALPEERSQVPTA